MHPAYPEINVQKDKESEHSIFRCYQELIRLRKNNPIIVWGKFERVEVPEKDVFVYKRILDDQEILVIANMGEETPRLKIEDLKVDNKFVIGNYGAPQIKNSFIDLRPYEAVVLSKDHLK